MSRTAVLVCVAVVAAVIPLQAGETVDLEVVHRIKNEAFARSQVMETLFQLTDVHGPRLSGSPGYRAAAEWAVGKLDSWGLEGAALEPWGEFGRGWSSSRMTLHMVRPLVAPLAAVPMAWCDGTAGPVQGKVILAPLLTKDERDLRWDLEKYAGKIEQYMSAWRGKLAGKIVLLDEEREFEEATEPAAERYDDEKLASLFEAPDPAAAEPYEWPIMKFPSDREERRKRMAALPLEVRADFWARQDKVASRLDAFFQDEGVVAVLRTDDRGDGAILFSEAAGLFEAGAPVPPPSLVVLPEQYNRLARLVDHGVEVAVEVDLDVEMNDTPVQGINVVAEIPGTSLANEIVMVGGHLDSWHAGTGAADNAAGSAIAMETLRILQTLGLKMKRTVRLGLWDGEEQGLHGSRAYVRRHFADPVTMKLLPDHADLAAYFNLDNGSGKIRGVYLQGNDMARPIFEAWLAPFKDLDVTTISIRNTGGTDHLSFDAVGLPGFQFIQDPLDYGSRTHHSNLDVYDHLEESDLMQAAAVMASVVYHAANREEKIPRKPLPDPLPPKR